MRIRGSTASAILVIFVLLVAGAAYYLTSVYPIWDSIDKGLDLEGGFNVELIAVDTPEAPVTEDKMRLAADVIRRRVDGLGVTEPNIRRKGDRRIVLELPGVKNPEEALEAIGRTALLEFVELPPNIPDNINQMQPDEFRKWLVENGIVVVTGANLKEAGVAFDNVTNKPLVSIAFDSEGSERFEEATRRNIHQPIFILLDKEIISSPVVQQAITGGKAVIENIGSVEDAQELTVLLNSGALPVELEVLRPRFVSALLGQDSIDQSQTAAIIGVSAVAAFMFLLYRIPGVWADVSLAVYIMLLFGILAAINAVLTLPGIAGIILTIGMAVDANVLIFERIRDELRVGKTVQAAVDAGFANAMRAIIDGNVTTLIIAAVLFFYFSSGPLRGFAVTLSIGILTSMFTAITVTRSLLLLMLRSGLVKDGVRLFGLRRGDR